MAVSPVAADCHGKQARCDEGVGALDSLPHWHVGRMLLIRWHCGLQIHDGPFELVMKINASSLLMNA